MSVVARKRVLPYKGMTRSHLTILNASGGGPDRREYDYDRFFDGTQYTESEGHPFNRDQSGHGVSDLGGPFFSQKRYTERGPSFIGGTWGTPDFTKTYAGLILPYLPQSGGLLQFPPDQLHSVSTLNAIGADLVDACKPTNSVANAAQFLGELIKDGIPHLVGASTWKDRTDRARGAGSDYLNFQFGWQPLISDIRSFIKIPTRAESVMRQFERDAGRVVRRRFNLPVERTREESKIDTVFSRAKPHCGDQSELYAAPAQATRVRELTRSVWFSGAFSYHMPSGYDSRTTMGRIVQLADTIGLNPTPELIWQLAPWSWAVDWFSSAGSVVSNLSDFITYGLVMRYGYTMVHTVVKDTYTREPTGFSAPFNSCGPLVLVTETKQRIKANPYGFGVTWDGLSSFQASILAALGITRR